MSTKLSRLQQCSNKPDFAKLLGLDPVFLTRVLYLRNTDNLYTNFSILKKNKTQRLISSPDPELKEIQRALSDLLMECLGDIRSENKVDNLLSHGFEHDRSIITNAEKHKAKKWVLNIDLSDFFDQFNFGRVSGYFIKNKFFQLNDNIAHVIGKIACYKNRLPQGSPSSPVITNLILLALDQRINNICKRNGCTYTRYADDITISTNKKIFPNEIVSTLSPQKVNLNKTFEKQFKRAGFEINHDKVRIQKYSVRQEVTGLTVNRKIAVNNEYAKKVRSMAHTLFKTGSYQLIDKKTGESRAGTLNELQGMLGFIDSIDKFNNRLSFNVKHEKNKREMLLAKFIYFIRFHVNSKTTIITEGKTDITYLRVALNSLYKTHPTLVTKKETHKGEVNDYQLSFFVKNAKSKFFLNFEDGSSHLKNFIKDFNKNIDRYKALGGSKPVIVILDNDSGSTGNGGILSLLASDAMPNISLSRDDIRNEKWLWITKNLYVVFTPLIEGGDSSLEDLFDSKTLASTLGGKVFNKTNEKCKVNEYGKEYFAKHVILKNKDSINFTNFSYLLSAIEEINDYHGSR